ncbi:MAG: ion transporter [Hespellia sp.]|nr:ion transporter [Hespellia sp.]
MRKRIYEIIEVSKEKDKASMVYDCFMMIAIILSIIPLAFKNQNEVFLLIDKVTVCIFIIDYLLRLATADFKLKEGKILSYIRYPFTPMAIIDLLSILPSLTVLNSGFRILKVVRLLRTFRVFRVFKALRYSKSLIMIQTVFMKQRDALIAVGTLAVAYIFVSALIVFNVEPKSFENFFDAIYWATVSLTTVGYGDIYPVTMVGRIVTMISSIFGVAIVALPAGIITAGYMEELEDKKSL